MDHIAIPYTSIRCSPTQYDARGPCRLNCVALKVIVNYSVRIPRTLTCLRLDTFATVKVPQILTRWLLNIGQGCLAISRFCPPMHFTLLHPFEVATLLHLLLPLLLDLQVAPHISRGIVTSTQATNPSAALISLKHYHCVHYSQYRNSKL